MNCEKSARTQRANSKSCLHLAFILACGWAIAPRYAGRKRGGGDRLPMGRKERLPGHRAAAPWCGLNTVLLEDARDCGSAELEADVLEGSAEPSVAPARVLPGHRHQLRGGIAPFSAGALLRGELPSYFAATSRRYHLKSVSGSRESRSPPTACARLAFPSPREAGARHS